MTNGLKMFLIAFGLASPYVAHTEASVGDPGCIDPAAPLLQIARDYRWPPPATPRSNEAFGDLVRYLNAPTSRAYHEVLAEYKSLQEIHPRDLHARLILGILYTSGPDLNYPGSQGYRHNAIANESNADSYGPPLLVEAIRADSTQWIAAVALTRIALASPEKQRTEQAVEAVQSALRKDSANIAVRLAWHDLLVAQGRYAEALAFAKSYTSSCTAAQHALAEALILNGDTTGITIYLKALDGAQPDALHRFFDDARVLASLGQLKRYAETPAELRSKWIRDFWNYTATTSARTVPAYLNEHIARATYADRNFRAKEFPVSSDHPVAWIDDTTHLVPWDVRGVLHMRLGAPLHRFRILNSCAESYEAWVYSGEGYPAIYWFARQCLSVPGGGPRMADWRPLLGLPNVTCGWQFITRPVPDLETTLELLRTNPEKIDRRHMYVLLAQWDDRYNVILHDCAKAGTGYIFPAGQRAKDEIARETTKSIAMAQWSASALPQLAHAARITLGVYEFRGENGAPELAAISWIRLNEISDATHSPERIKLSYVLADTLMHASLKDTVVDVTATDRANGYMRAMTLLPNALAGAGRVRVIARDPADSTRGGVRTLPFEVRAIPGLALSDVVLAAEGSTGGLRRGTSSMDPIPGHILPLGTPFRLFFEVYGLQSREPVNIAIRIVNKETGSALAQLRKLFKGKVTERTISFDQTPQIDARGVMSEDVTVAGDLAPGGYIIEITLKSAGGAVAKRYTTATVVKE